MDGSLSSAGSALQGGDNDRPSAAEAPTRNAVAMVFGGCTGTLVTPNAVLTADHCRNRLGGLGADPAESWRATDGWVFFGPDPARPLWPGTDEPVRICAFNHPPAGGGSDMIVVRLDRRIDPSLAVPRPVLTSSPPVADLSAFWTGQRVEVVGYGDFRDRQFAFARVVRHPLGSANDWAVGAPPTPSCGATAPPGEVCFGYEPGDSGGPTFWTDDAGVVGEAGATWLVAIHEGMDDVLQSVDTTTWASGGGGDSAVGPWLRRTLDPDEDGVLLGEIGGPLPPFLDPDGDDVPARVLGDLDLADNCPDDFNPDQLDRDCDGRGDVCDSCPLVANPGQEDRDADRIGDACDLCPDDADAEGAPDGDDDGVPDACDLCPRVRSSQRNCNEDAERAVGAPALGDECDPAPCADHEAREHEVAESAPYVRAGNNHFDVDALAAFPNDGPGTFGHRFCRCDVALEDSRPVRRLCASDSWGCVVPTDPDEVQGSYDLPRDDSTRRGWRPIETAEGFDATRGALLYGADPACAALGVPDEACLVGAAVYALPQRPRGPAFGRQACVDTGFGLVTCFPDAPGDAALTWMLARDVRRFLEAGEPAPPAGTAELSGVLWSLVEVRPLFGCGGGACSLDRELSSNFWSGRVRDRRVRTPLPPARIIAAAALPARACPECFAAFPEGWLALPCLREPGGCRPPDPFAEPVVRLRGPVDLPADFVGPSARALLLDPGLAWTTAVEPAGALPEGAPRLAALAVGSDVVKAWLVVSPAGQLAAAGPNLPPPPWEYPNVEPAGWEGPGARTGYGLALWGVAGRLYLAGGVLAGSDGLAGDVWVYHLAEETWARLPARGPLRPARVLAMTLDFEARRLLLLDVADDASRGPGGPHGLARLLRVDASTGEAALVASWPRLHPEVELGLAGAPGGIVYLVAGRPASFRHEVLRLRAGGGGVELLGHARGAGALAGQPHASGAGVSFPVERRDGSVDVTGVRAVDLLPGRASVLASLL